jgi:hypothetical protein
MPLRRACRVWQGSRPRLHIWVSPPPAGTQQITAGVHFA